MTLKFPEGHKGLVCTIQNALPYIPDAGYYQQAVFIADKIKEWQNDPSKIPGTVWKRDGITKQMMCCNNPCGAGISSFCYHSTPHEKNKHCPIKQDCNCTSGGKIARCVPVIQRQSKAGKQDGEPENANRTCIV
jgi:hypothetical protein